MKNRSLLDDSPALAWPKIDPTRLKAVLASKVDAIRNLSDRKGLHRAVARLDDGISSAVALGLVVRALGPQKVLVLHLPADSNAGEPGQDRARRLAESLGIPAANFRTICLSGNLAADRTITEFRPLPAFESWQERWTADLIELERLKIQRLAATGLHAFMVGSTSLTDHLLGADRLLGAVTDLEPLRDLFQVEVYQAGAIIDLPEAVLRRPPVNLPTADPKLVRGIDLVLFCAVLFSPAEALSWSRGKVDPTLAQEILDRLERAQAAHARPGLLNAYRPW